MDAFIQSPGAELAAWAALPSGAALLVRSCVLAGAARSLREQGPARTLLLARALRAALVGGAMVGFAAGVYFESFMVTGLALIIGGEELLETSAVVHALRGEVARRDRPATSPEGSTAVVCS